MSNLVNLTNQISQIKSDLATAITAKGVACSTTDAFEDYANKVNNILLSENGSSLGKFLVRCIDYNGDILKEDWLNPGQVFTLPNPPTNHERLTFQEWSSSAPIVDNKVTVVDNHIMIGATYVTKSGKTEFLANVNKLSGLTVSINNLPGTKDWGDGTIDTTTSHTYNDYGEYVITCDATSFPSRIGSSNNDTCIYAIYLGENVTSIPTDFLYNTSYDSCWQYSLKELMIPSGHITTYPNIAYFGNLKGIVVPRGVTSVPYINNCYWLTTVVIPNTCTFLQYISNLPGIRHLAIPDSVTSVGNGFGSSLCLDYALLKNATFSTSNSTYFGGNSYIGTLIIPKYASQYANIQCKVNYIKFGPTLTMFSCGNFSDGKHNVVIDFTDCLVVPTSYGTFNGLSYYAGKESKILVPASMYQDYLNSSQWSSYSSYIYPIE